MEIEMERKRKIKITQKIAGNNKIFINGQKYFVHLPLHFMCHLKI